MKGFFQKYWKWVLGISLFILYSLFLGIFFSNWGKDRADIEAEQYKIVQKQLQSQLDSIETLLVTQKQITRDLRVKEIVLRNKQTKLEKDREAIKPKYDSIRTSILTDSFATKAKFITDRFNRKKR